MSATLASIKAILLDLDGTLLLREAWIPGAVETVRWCVAQGYAVRFITNTSLKNRRQLAQHFREAGLDLSDSLFFTPARAAYQWFQGQRLASGILALIHPDLLEDLAGLPLTGGERADYVLVGDMGDAWALAPLNAALRALVGGAQLTALQRNPRWWAKDGLRIDAGAFVAALEYGAGTRCETVFGKPARLFFEMALRDTGVQPDQTIMVGDDLEADILGARQCGIRGALVRTGKFRPEQITADTPPIDLILDDITHLPEALTAGSNHP